MSNYIYLFVSICFGAIGQVALKKGMQIVGRISITNISSNIEKIILNPYIFSGVVFYGLSLIIWLIVLSRVELSKAYPLVSLGYVITFIWGVVFLGEQISTAKIIGLIFIVIGILIIARGGI